MISVKVAHLASLRTFRIRERTKLGVFCSKHDITLNSKVRVNSERRTAEYSLKAGDIITVLERVSGG